MSVTDIKIAYIGGGSQGWARGLMNDLALEPRLSGTVLLYDLHFDAAKTNQRIGNLISNKPEAKGAWRYKAVRTIEEALTDSDFVIISILPGSLDDMERDVHVPEKFGIYQSVGDTVGPGGISRALRTIPIYVEIAEKIKHHAPNAWVINYTNPMSLCTRTLYEIFPQVKAIGCCHEVFETQQLLACMVEEMLGEKVKTRNDIQISVSGINHFTWVTKASYKKYDLIPLYAQFVEKYKDTGYEKEVGTWTESVFKSCNRVKFDLFQKYGAIAAAGDRHLAEFMPAVYLKDPETVEQWKFHLTTVHFRKKVQQQKRRMNERILSGEIDVPITPSGEDGVDILLSLVEGKELVTNVNFPNLGQIANLKKGAIVETNALIRKNSVQPILTDELPIDVTNMIQRHIYNQESVLQAALQNNRQLVRNAFVNDPLVSSISTEQAEKLFEDLIMNTKTAIGG